MSRLGGPLLAALLLSACGAAPPTETAPLTITSESMHGEVTPTAPSAEPATPAPDGFFEDIELTGSGTSRERFAMPHGAMAIAHLRHDGEYSFRVWAVGEDGRENKVLVNRIGPYVGTVLLHEDAHSVGFRIEAHAPWQITVQHVSKAQVWDRGSELTGEGDGVVQLEPPPSDHYTRVEMTHNGEANFIVSALRPGDRSLLVNEIGRFSGQRFLPDGAVLLEIIADGTWSMVTH